MKNLLKVREVVVNLDQLNYADREQGFLYLYFEGNRKVEFEGEEAEAVWAVLNDRSDKTSLEPPKFETTSLS